MDPSEQMRELLRYANYTHVAEGLTRAGYPVSFATVSRWAKGANVTPRAVAEVSRLLGIAKEPRPEWAEALFSEVGTIRSLLDQMALTQAGAMGILGELLARLPPVGADSEGGQESAGRSDTRGQ